MKYIHSRKSLYNRLLNLSCVIGSIDLQDISIHDNENNLNALHKDLETILDDILEKDEEEEPQTFKFKVGDKVQVLRQSPLAIQGWVGKIGTIIEFDEKRYACYSVKMESGSVIYFAQCELELAKHNTKFQVGQSVKVVGNLSNRVLGKTGKVVEIRDDDRGRYTLVDLDDGSFSRGICFSDDELDLATHTTKFHIDQEVEILPVNTVAASLVGKRGKISLVWGCGDFIYEYDVKLEGHANPYSFRESELKLIEDEPAKPALGQEVEIVDNGHTLSSYIGMKGHINFVSGYEDTTYPYHVYHVQLSDGIAQWFMADEVKPVSK